jgi:UDPglucose 6-dehydrogenase
VVCVDNDLQKVGRLQMGDLPVYEPGLQEIVEKNMQAGRLRFSSELEASVNGKDLVMIAVGTPPGEEGHLNLTALWNVIKSVKKCARGDMTIALKSTVPVGTCEAVSLFLNANSNCRFDVVSTPEFLRQGTAVADFLSPDRLVIGCQTEAAKQKMNELYDPIDCPVIFADWNSSEMIKYASNAFLALKITYINTIANLCEEVGANIHHVALGVGLDHRIGPAFLKAGAGFGGSCLPKDTDALIALGESHGVNMSLFRQVLALNREQGMRIVKKLEARLNGLAGKKIAVLGLSFKANTNDVRESPSLRIIERIQKLGGEVIAYDPAVNMDQLRQHLSFAPAADPYDAAAKTDALVILTEWEEFYGLDFQRLRSIMNQPLIVDGRNLFAPHLMESFGFEYVPVGISNPVPTDVTS